MILIEKTGRAPVQVDFFQDIVAFVGFVQLLSGGHVVEAHLVKGVGPPGGRGVDLDGFDLIRLVMDVDDVSFLQVAGFGHFITPFIRIQTIITGASFPVPFHRFDCRQDLVIARLIDRVVPGCENRQAENNGRNGSQQQADSEKSAVGLNCPGHVSTHGEHQAGNP